MIDPSEANPLNRDFDRAINSLPAYLNFSRRGGRHMVNLREKVKDAPFLMGVSDYVEAPQQTQTTLLSD